MPDMTLPDERYRALVKARSFLFDLIDPKKTPGVPSNVRMCASSILKHFPDDYHSRILAEQSPNILESTDPPLEPVYKMVKEYDLRQKTN
jgi:hypothetical protein